MIKRIEEIGAHHESMTFKRHVEKLGDAQIHDSLTVSVERISTDDAATKVSHCRRPEIRALKYDERIKRIIDTSSQKRWVDNDGPVLKRRIQI